MNIAMNQTADVTRYHNGVKYHRAIYQCLMKHDSDGARALMWTHIMRNIDAFKENES